MALELSETPASASSAAHPLRRIRRRPACRLVGRPGTNSGYVPDEAAELVARELGLPPAHVYGVVTFYTMYARRKPGKNHLQLLYQRLVHDQRGVQPARAPQAEARGPAGRDHQDGLFTLSEVECLAACGQAR